MQLTFLRKKIRTKVVTAEFVYSLPVQSLRHGPSCYKLGIHWLDMDDKYRGYIDGFRLDRDSGYPITAYSYGGSGLCVSPLWTDFYLPGVSEEQSMYDFDFDQCIDKNIFKILAGFKRLDLIKDSDLEEEAYAENEEDDE